MQIFRKLTIMSPFTVMGIWGFVKSNNDDNTLQQNATKELLAKADTLFDQGNYRNIYDLLSNYKVIFYNLYFRIYIFTSLHNYNIYVSIQRMYNYNMFFILYRIVRMLKSYGV